MAGIGFFLAVIMALMLGPWAHGGAARTATINPIAAFHDPFNESQSTGYLLGASSGGKWLKAEAAAGLIPAGEQYRLYTLAGEAGASTGGKPAKGDVPCADAWYVTLTPYPIGRGDMVAVGGPWNVMPRAVKSASTDSPVYREAAADILKSQGIANPKVNLTQVLQVDLDGDGVAEVLVSATNYAKFGSGSGVSPDARAGDYSLVFLRKVVQGKVVTRIITGEYYPKAKKFNAPAEHRVIGVLDLNGDGVLEIVLSGRYYEGDWVDAYRVEGAEVIKLFGMGCGV
jgi:hypothetical protein